jgi:hypothetical protein
LLLTSLLAALLSVLVAPSAKADDTVVRDSAGDNWSPGGGQGGYTSEGSVPNTDLRRTRLLHQRRLVILELKYVDLKRRVSDEINVEMQLRTDSHALYTVSASVDWLGRSTLYGLAKGRDQIQQNCDSLGGTTSFPHNRLRIRIGRECLGHPRWVRFRGKAESYKESTGLFLDSATDDGPEPQEWSLRVHRAAQ